MKLYELSIHRHILCYQNGSISANSWMHNLTLDYLRRVNVLDIAFLQVVWIEEQLMVELIEYPKDGERANGSRTTVATCKPLPLESL